MRFVVSPIINLEQANCKIRTLIFFIIILSYNKIYTHNIYGQACFTEITQLIELHVLKTSPFSKSSFGYPTELNQLIQRKLCLLLELRTRNRGDVVSWLREFIQEIDTEEERSDILKFITGSRAAAFDRSIRVINILSAIKL